MAMASVFVSCPFHGPYKDLIACIRRAAAGFHLQTVSADQYSAARPFVDDIQREIKDSRIVVADITGNNPNVLNEIGLAQASRKALILISQDSLSDAPANIRNLRIVQYAMTDLQLLQERVADGIQEVLFPSDVLRSMIVPRSLGFPSMDSRFVIAASPLSWRRATNQGGGYPLLRRTESDYVGIRGILQTFGQFYGFEALPDQIDPEDYRDEVACQEMDVYCIASPKANRWTGKFLEEFGNKWVPKLEFRADPLSSSLRNVRVSIFSDDTIMQPPGWVGGKGDRFWRDFGIIVRGPNPFHPADRMFAVMAGRSSLGTQAACTAFTDITAVKKIADFLRPHSTDIEDHRQPFWALASMARRDDERQEAIPESLTIWGAYPIKARSLFSGQVRVAPIAR
jgi:hypothetical protein